ncbi:MAG TPA: hypothetical protein VK607_17160 [Kofleriaceae bacterium]|nr:hypothetical protein [Kofleriaceae bacterium]
MTVPHHCSVLVLCLITACGSPDYGAPSDATMINLSQGGGFGGPQVSRSVRITGTAATYMFGAATSQETIDSVAVADIIAALQDIGFLDLQAEYTTCTPEISDAETVMIYAKVAAGSHTLRHYLGCMGGVFDSLSELDRTIYERSGFNAWLAGR